MAKSYLEEKFLRGWERDYPFLPLLREYKPLTARRFRLDFAHVESRVGIEIQGGTWGRKGAHSSGKGLNRDYEKLNLIQSDGWIVFQLSGDMLNLRGQRLWFPLIAKAIKRRSLRHTV